MSADFLRRAVRDGPDAFGPSEYGKRAIACYLHWTTLAGTAMVLAFLWATWPYHGSTPAQSGFVGLLEYHLRVIPWLLGRPLRLLAALPLTFWLVQWLRGPY